MPDEEKDEALHSERALVEQYNAEYSPLEAFLACLMDGYDVDYSTSRQQRIRLALKNITDVDSDRIDDPSDRITRGLFKMAELAHDDYVELTDLKREDFLRILTEPKHALTKQYAELLATEGLSLTFTSDGIEALADVAFEVNRTTQNIGALSASHDPGTGGGRDQLRRA